MSRKIDRLHARHVDNKVFFENYQRHSVPVVISDLVDKTYLWDKGYIGEMLADKNLGFRHYGKERKGTDKSMWKTIGSGVNISSLAISEFFEHVKTGYAQEQDIYLAKCSIRETGLANSKAVRRLGEYLAQQSTLDPIDFWNIWLGPAGHTECLHYDAIDGLLVQIVGEKSILLFPPSEIGNLYPFPVISHLTKGLKLRCWFSRVTPDTPDFLKYPKYRRALDNSYRVKLLPGEGIYIPAGWWHEIVGGQSEINCSINSFFKIVPYSRAMTSWSHIRTTLGTILSLPHLFITSVHSYLHKDRKERMDQIKHTL